ncbi:TraB/GumN family protein [Paenibacillus thiaminolyticus]|uniref:TraB/GumN family protein n=1 Tax=Paenibacillus thiaminolyticus TaxID=49283 RepID=UPI00234FE848|nr:TraB/GumN family protein [Paenibacillus thiaminolyticus]WCR28692.1 TraB/GumN family protein [Paenibacillus thiaminolyticus]
MKYSRWSRVKRSVASGLAVLIAMLGFVIPAQANEGPAVIPQISTWSIKTLNEGEKYGIFPLAWYVDGTFQQPITQDKFQALIEATSAKLDALELKKTGQVTIPSGAKEITRKTVIDAVYGVLAQYEWPESLDLDMSDPVAFLKKNGIVYGTSKGLELDKPSTVEQASVMASRLVQFGYDAAGGGAKGLLWKATKGQNTLYLLGSIHLGIPDMYPMQKPIRDAFAQSDTLWVEVNLLDREASMQYFTRLMTYQDGTQLKEHVSEQTYEKLQKVLEQLNMAQDTFDPFKPWAITTNLSMANMTGESADMAQGAALGVDMYFTNSALLTGKPIHELEGLKFQADLFNNVPPAVQEKELNEVLDQILAPAADKPDDASKQLRQWQLLWAKADLEKFSESFTGSVEMVKSDSAQRLFGERDKNMAKKLMELLDKEGASTHFVVVGAGHFVIKDMIIDQLKANGYEVEFVK